MSKTNNNWGDPKIKKELMEIIEKAPSVQMGYQNAAEHFKVSYNAAYQAYRYVTGIYTKKKKQVAKKNAKKFLVPALQTPALKNNPFEIKTDISVTGARGSASIWIPALMEQVLKLEPGDTRSSVNIPITVAPGKNNAASIITTLRKILSEHSNKVIKNTAIICKSIYDAKDNYVGTRIWRKS